ncbi:MAG: hypothetical protein IJM30_08220 [Thermoguttaceae bacterium]|nr:hypothetical protein [Thermoguttaceae bacterium]
MKRDFYEDDDRLDDMVAALSNSVVSALKTPSVKADYSVASEVSVDESLVCSTGPVDGDDVDSMESILTKIDSDARNESALADGESGTEVRPRLTLEKNDARSKEPSLEICENERETSSSLTLDQALGSLGTTITVADSNDSFMVDFDLPLSGRRKERAPRKGVMARALGFVLSALKITFVKLPLLFVWALTLALACVAILLAGVFATAWLAERSGFFTFLFIAVYFYALMPIMWSLCRFLWEIAGESLGLGNFTRLD